MFVHIFSQNDFHEFGVFLSQNIGSYLTANKRRVQDGKTAFDITFDKVKQVDDEENDYWSARDLSKLLGYTEYNKVKMLCSRLKSLAKIAVIQSRNIFSECL